MNKLELLQKCKEMGIKGISSKSKSELLLIIKEHQQKQEIVIVFDNSDNKIKFSNVLKELLNQTQKDKLRKVCKNCNELGHNVVSSLCKINIERNNKLKQKIKKYILSQNCLDSKTIDDYCVDLSVLLNVTPNLCRTLYNEIPLEELLDRHMDLSIYLKTINQLNKKCHECNKNIMYIQTNTHHLWNGKCLCDTCWSKYEEQRKIMWKKIQTYKPIECEICCSKQNNLSERYHYDHLNMFNKDRSIFNMVNEGVNIEEIYTEIDKCHILCLSCHHIVTDIEHKLGFTRIKQTLTRNLNMNEMTEEEYKRQTNYYQNIYTEKMTIIYKELAINFNYNKW